jgi:leucyl-tRNA synthetase
MERNILNFSLNKCVANIYTLLNFLEKNKIYLGKNELSKKVLVCLFPIIPRMSSSISKKIFNTEISEHQWPEVNENLIEENQINLPIQIKGKLISTINTNKGYKEKDLLEKIYMIEKVKNKITGKKIVRIINVQDKIINIITN